MRRGGSHGVGTRGGIGHDLGRRGGLRSVRSIGRLARRDRSIEGSSLTRSDTRRRCRRARLGLGGLARSLFRGRLLIFLNPLQTTIGNLWRDTHGARGRADGIRLARTLRLFRCDFVFVVATIVLEILVDEHLKLVRGHMLGHQTQLGPSSRYNELAIGRLAAHIVEHVGERIILRELALFGRGLRLLLLGGVVGFGRRSWHVTFSCLTKHIARSSQVNRARGTSCGSLGRARFGSHAGFSIRAFPTRSRIGALAACSLRQIPLRELFFGSRRRSPRIFSSHYASAAFARASSTIMSRRVSRSEQCSHKRHATELVSHGSFSLSSASVMPLR